MKRLAAILMFAAWLLHGAMPAIATAPRPSVEDAHQTDAAEQHSAHHRTDSIAGDDGASLASESGHKNRLCPHKGLACAAPFCAACLVLLPQIAYGDDTPFVHPYPAPEAAIPPGPAGRAPLTPPPRA